MEDERRRKLLKKIAAAQQKSSNAKIQPFKLLNIEKDLIWWVQRIEKHSTKHPTSNYAKVGNDDDDVWLSKQLEEFLILENSQEPITQIQTQVKNILESSSNNDVVREGLIGLLGFSDFALNLIPQILQKKKNLFKKRANKRQQQPKDISFRGAGGFGSEPSHALPSGSSRNWIDMDIHSSSGSSKSRIRYESVHVPPPQRNDLYSSQDDLISTSRFGISQKAFQGISMLNRLQSRLFHAAYETSENLLICAPTGAGKTNVAMTAIAREIDRNEGNPKAVKIVYVAPMKALAQEIVSKFSERLASLKMQVKELTGDTQLSRAEIEKTQVIVTTPEKWDVITRKSGGDGTLVELVKLLIIDEVHLVGEDRGPVIEALVARTIRQVERTQQMVRIVGLSATLPNYSDVALFLRVNPERGMFFFDNSFRPVPLDQTFIGVSIPSSNFLEKQHQEQNPQQLPSQNFKPQDKRQQLRQQALLEQSYNQIACLHALESVERGNQVMVFVHTRKDTSNTAKAILEISKDVFRKGNVFSPKFRNVETLIPKFAYRVQNSKNQEVQFLFSKGLGIHHAGMSREDRSLTEEMFVSGVISVLFCTATLAWGVNLPAHTVIVKGTQIYAPERGGICELNSADVFQCFGRAGRPQYDTSGEAILITEHAQLARYLKMLNHALPLDSKLIPALPDALNAEIVSGTVSTLKEASEWLSYTFLFIRMLKSPITYGVSLDERKDDPNLESHKMKLIATAAQRLSEARMIRFGITKEKGRNIGGYYATTPLGVTDLGRVASHFYVHHETVEALFNEQLRPVMTFPQLINAICSSKEFEQLKLREEEIVEVKRLVVNACPFELTTNFGEVNDILETPQGKAFILFQAYISRYPVDAFTLHSDMNFISQNAARIARALFEVCLARGWLELSLQMLEICGAIERRAWWSPIQHPLRQVAPSQINLETVALLEMDENREWSLMELSNTTPEILAHEIPVLGTHRANRILAACKGIPYCEVQILHLQPITAGILKLSLQINAKFNWKEKIHGESQGYYLFIDDGEWILHSERVTLSKERKSLNINLTVTLFPANLYFIRLESDSSWLNAGFRTEINLTQLKIPQESQMFYTDLLNLEPISVTALKNDRIRCSFTHFNPVQTQCFHVLYHRDESCLIGAPTGSGKTTLAELAMYRVIFQPKPEETIVVYVAPMKALVMERIMDWKNKFSEWNKTIVELTGDSNPSSYDLKRASLIVATPEKFEIVSRFWEKDEDHFLKRTALVVFDEIHLLGEDRGASLEALVTRIKTCSRALKKHIRLVGLSTALANANDIGQWFKKDDKETVVVYNFRPAIRIVPLEVHLSGFPGAHYCPRMASMNKPIFHAIERHSPNKPVLIFVASRRQTRLTAFDLISLCAATDDPRRFLKNEVGEVEVEDDAFRHSLQFGIALHHAGLSKKDRQLSERAFSSGACQVLIATSTLAWGVNLPAHLVIIKGTEYFDASSRRYEPFPVMDVMQMMGRAGRPQFGDEKGVAVIFVHDQLKQFYKRFLYEPFPVESNFLPKFPIHLNAEIAAGRVVDFETAEKFFSDSYFAIRVKKNPSFYGKTDELFYQKIVSETTKLLSENNCCELKGEKKLIATPLGVIAAKFDLKPETAYHLSKTCSNFVDENWILETITKTIEFQDIPVRHKEDEFNELLSTSLQHGLGSFKFSELGSASCKSYLLLQAKLQNISLPIHDYITDSIQVVDIASRVLPGLIEIACMKQIDYQLGIAACKLMNLLNPPAEMISTVISIKSVKRNQDMINCNFQGIGGGSYIFLLDNNGKMISMERGKGQVSMKYSPNSVQICLTNGTNSILRKIENE